MSVGSVAGMLETIANVALALVPLAVLAMLAVVLEVRAPWRCGVRPDGLRWLQSSVLMIIGTGTARLILPLSIYSASVFAAAAGIGLFHRVDAPLWLAFIAGLLALDFFDYVRHRLEHKFSLIWRIHRVHHSDRQLDASSALRFHPLEALLTSALHVSVVLALGVPMAAALVYAALTLLFDIWQHANIRAVPGANVLETVIVTPRLHRMHHSYAPDDAAVNLGAILSIWDRMLGTYRRPTMAQAEAVIFGLGQGTDTRFDTLGQLLGDPLRPDATPPANASALRAR